jgi:hypothetical protein
VGAAPFAVGDVDSGKIQLVSEYLPVLPAMFKKSMIFLQNFPRMGCESRRTMKNS